MNGIEFEVYGIAQPQGSSRAFVPKGWTRAVVTSANPKNKDWRLTVAHCAGVVMGTERGGRLFEGPVALMVRIELPRPKSLKSGVTQHTKRPDLDKLVRSLGDALSKVVWADDAQVVRIDAEKRYAPVGRAPKVSVQVQEAR